MEREASSSAEHKPIGPADILFFFHTIIDILPFTVTGLGGIAREAISVASKKMLAFEEFGAF